MSEIKLRTFSLSKTCQEGASQDAHAYSLGSGRFAVADGVSRSYHPEFVAQTLCSRFAEASGSMEEWISQFDAETLSAVSADWNERTRAFEAEMIQKPGMGRYIQAWRQNLPMGSSTFAGVIIDLKNKTLSYGILGDTALFVMPQGEPYKAFSTAPTTADGIIEFDNTPQCVSNDVRNCEGSPSLMRYGEWATGTLPLKPGYIAILTDGAAKWLQSVLLASPSAINTLWDLKTDTEFEAFAQSLRKQGEMDDDLTAILLKVPEDPTCFAGAPSQEAEAADADFKLFEIADCFPFYIDNFDPYIYI